MNPTKDLKIFKNFFVFTEQLRLYGKIALNLQSGGFTIARMKFEAMGRFAFL